MDQFDASEFIDQKYSVEDIDNLMAQCLEIREEKKRVSEELKAINKELSEVEEKLTQALEENLKKNWDYNGYKATVKVEKYPKMDKDPSKVKEVAEYFKDKGGEDMLWSYFSVNHNSLRSFVKKTLEENPEEKFPDGIELGYERKTIQMRKSK